MIFSSNELSLDAGMAVFTVYCKLFNLDLYSDILMCCLQDLQAWRPLTTNHKYSIPGKMIGESLHVCVFKFHILI